jgi:hypothetical protein
MMYNIWLLCFQVEQQKKGKKLGACPAGLEIFEILKWGSRNEKVNISEE